MNINELEPSVAADEYIANRLGLDAAAFTTDEAAALGLLRHVRSALDASWSLVCLEGEYQCAIWTLRPPDPVPPEGYWSDVRIDLADVECWDFCVVICRAVLTAVEKDAPSEIPTAPAAVPEPFFEKPPLFSRISQGFIYDPLQSAMTPAIDPDDFDKAVQEVAKVLESPVEWVPANSSNLAAVAYQEDLKLLLVEFKGGQVYNYAGVPVDVYEGLINAESKGGYFAANIRNVYPCEKVER